MNYEKKNKHMTFDDLINICNKLKLSPLHLEDVVEDFLVDAQ